MPGTHPPRPRLTLNVGITGHRATVLTPEAGEQLRPIIDQVFSRLAKAMARLHLAEPQLFADAEPQLRLHSPLATGADQLAARSARSNGFNVRALLPFDPDIYCHDFAEGREREEFEDQLSKADEIFALPGERADVEAAYVLVGKAVVAAADILIALWDGGVGNGPGGTAHVVDLALAGSVRVIHVLTDPVGVEGERVRLLVGGNALEPIVEPFNLDAQYDALLRDTLTPHTGRELEQLTAFFAEHEHRRNWRIEYPLLLASLGVKGLRFAPWRQSSIEDDIRSEGRSLRGGDADHAWRNLDRAYGWANFLAIRYAQLFRSGHVTNYFLSAFAVILALFGLIVPSIKVFLVLAELGTIGLLFLNTRAGTRGDWHRRWLQYRHLAESLRPWPI